MEALLTYLLKVSIVLALFYLAYQFLLKNETFFKINRHFLIAGILTAFILPFVTLTDYVEITTIPIEETVNQISGESVEESTNLNNWITIFSIIYLIGVLILGINFIIQLISLSRLIKNNSVIKQGRFHHVKISRNIAPFSFFNYIFYNPERYSQGELSTIIKHEKAHSSQWHSIDVILCHIITIFTWMNPFSWLYKTNIKQNLEFLADESATKEIPSIKNYQYTLLKVSGNQFCAPIVNHFYNSLIKKRIVMLNKSKSKKSNSFKIMLILPLLAIFMVSFNTETIYVPITQSDQSSKTELSKLIEIIITKNTTDKELLKLKKDLLKKGVDFSYTVVHNSENEIIDIAVNFSTTNKEGKKTKSSSNFSSDNEGIEPIHIVYNEDTHSFSIGKNEDLHYQTEKEISIELDEDTDEVIWISADGDKKEHKTIEITNENGKETIKVNGKKVSRKEFESLKEKDGITEERIKIRKTEGPEPESSFIMKVSEKNEDKLSNGTSVKEREITYIHKDDNKEPLIVIDGRETNKKEMHSIDPSSIESINVLKDGSAKEKYGKKGKNGVIEIITKKAE